MMGAELLVATRRFLASEGLRGTRARLQVLADRLGLEHVAFVPGVVVLAAAGLALIEAVGLEVPFMQRMVPDRRAMLPMTAALFILLALGLILEHLQRRWSDRLALGSACLALGMILALLGMQLLAWPMPLPLRIPAVATLIGSLIVGAALALLLLAPRRAGGVVASLGLVGLLLGLFRLLDLTVGHGQLLDESMAPSTALGLALLSGGILVHRDLPFLELLGDRSLQGQVLRLAVPWTTLVPMVAALGVSHAVHAGHLSQDLAFAMLATAIGSGTTLLIWLHAIRLGQIDRQRARQVREARSRERMLAGLLDAIPAVIVLAHPDTAIRRANRAYHQRFGTAEQSIAGQSFLTQMPHAEIGRIESLLSWLSPEAPSQTLEMVVSEPRGARRTLSWSFRMLFDAAGRPVDLVAAGWDVSVLADVCRAQAAEIELNQDLAAVAHHDLDHGIRELAAAANRLEDHLDGPATAALSAQVAAVAVGIRRLRRLTKPARMPDLEPATRATLQRQRLALAEVVAEAVADLAGELQERSVEVEIGHGLAIVMGERARLVRLFRALIGNAMELCTQAPRRILIEAGNDPQQHDTFVLAAGPGVRMAEALAPFSLRQEAGQAVAGLVLCRRLAKELGGVLQMTDASPHGCGFQFSLPNLLADPAVLDPAPADSA